LSRIQLIKKDIYTSKDDIFFVRLIKIYNKFKPNFGIKEKQCGLLKKKKS